MAYNYPNYFFQQPQQMAVPQQQVQSGGGFVSVRSEMEARSYPVAYGNSVTMKDETAPYIYTKTMGFSQLDRPIFDKYKLVKEEPEEPAPSVDSSSVVGDEMEKMKKEIHDIWVEINELKAVEKYGA